ncbi:MAG: hypothetical protein JWP30_161 [Homoserinimonas sp.]|nr:hypothetical protein [Homoserinimonas sp.]
MHQGEHLSEEMVEQLALALTTTVMPVVDEVLRTLRLATPADSRQLRTMGDRLANASSRATQLIAPLPAHDERAANSDAEENERAGGEARARENAIRATFEQRVHGPILGRLSACAMALNFYAAEADSHADQRSDLIIRAVIDHLQATRKALHGLSEP